MAPVIIATASDIVTFFGSTNRDVILVQRLLKNDVNKMFGAHAYALYSDACVRAMGIDPAAHPAGMARPVRQDHVALALAGLPIGLGAVVADKGLGVGLRQAFGLLTWEPLQHCAPRLCNLDNRVLPAHLGDRPIALTSVLLQ
jgi:hypothetical protein